MVKGLLRKEFDFMAYNLWLGVALGGFVAQKFCEDKGTRTILSLLWLLVRARGIRRIVCGVALVLLARFRRQTLLRWLNAFGRLRISSATRARKEAKKARCAALTPLSI